MTEKEMVVKGLECHLDEKVICDSCPYSVECGCFSLLLNDALKVLKEQEPRAPHYTYLQYSINGIVHEIKHPECPRCFENGLTLWDAEINEGQAYCERCGQEVKWDA